MTATKLKRMNFAQVDSSLVDSREQLAKQAQDILGYKKLAQAIAIPGALLFNLRELGIEPLVRSSVEAYKAQKARPGMWSSQKTAYRLLALAMALGMILAAIFPSLTSSAQFQNVLILTLLGVGTLFCAIGAFVNYVEAGGTRITRQWKLVPVTGYTGTIPEFALSRAVQIKNAVPAAELVVDQLFEEIERKERPAPDPFLVVRLKDETYYIDVWDEKEYEATL